MGKTISSFVEIETPSVLGIILGRKIPYAYDNMHQLYDINITSFKHHVYSFV